MFPLPRPLGLPRPGKLARLFVPCALSVVLLAALARPAAAATPPPAHTFEAGAETFLLDGRPFVIRCGEVHFPRVPRAYWRHRLQMCRALGLNAVCVYLFWNFHEWKEGEFDWSGPADAAEFCRLAQEEGLWVLLRPGPYSCAEWEMGGLPWWLLRREGIRLRTQDPQFLEPAVGYLREVGRVLAPLQITRGGPLLMVQVENEYGSFGQDAAYMGALREALQAGGFEVPLFACNPAGVLARGFREDLLQVVNFGAGAAPKAFEKLREVQRTGPLMNGEYYPGWFDTWGRRHRTGPVEPVTADLEYMLGKGLSFSIYMAHGGTTPGLWAGADRPFSPDTSSYDYDAPISEAGGITPKFHAIRAVMSRHLAPGETLPEPPPAPPGITFPPATLGERAPLLAQLPAPQAVETPGPMEALGQSRGLTLLRTTLPPGPAGPLRAAEVHDFGWVFLDGRPVGVMDRRSRRFQVELPARAEPARLEVLVEAMGRVNFGPELLDRKGLHAPVTLAGAELKGWQAFPLPLEAPDLARLLWQPAAGAPGSGPAFWRGSFSLQGTGDTFLDLRSWGKGVVWVNGHCLGRFWNIGPTQTMYCPGPYLQPGQNEILVLDLLGPSAPEVAGLAQPILDQLRPELDFSRRPRATGTFTPGDIAAAGAFSPEVQWQEARLPAPATGRYLCLEVLSTVDGGPAAAVAELEAVDARGAALSKAPWKVLWSSGEEKAPVSAGEPENALDGQPATAWQSPATPQPPRLVLDLGRSETLTALRYLPRAGGPGEKGRVREYRIYLSEQPFGLKLPR